jgi:hypothetical protein
VLNQLIKLSLYIYIIIIILIITILNKIDKLNYFLLAS